MSPLAIAAGIALLVAGDAPAPRVLVLDVKASSMDAAAVVAFTKLLTHELAVAMAPMPVIDVHEVARLADLEADRQDAGCTTTSCLAEVAGAYGADLVVFGEEAMVADEHVVTLQMFDARRAEARGRSVIRVAHVGDLPGHVPTAVRALVAWMPTRAMGEPVQAKVRPDALAPAAQTDADRALEIGGYLVAGSFAAVGGVLLLGSAVVLTTPTDSDSAALGFGLLGTGVGTLLVAPVIAGGTWLCYGAPTQEQP